MPKQVKSKISKKAVLFISLALILCVTVGGVVALIISQSDLLSNTFVPVFVKCDVNATESDGVTSDVSIQNIGDINAFIRASVVVNFVSDTDSAVVLGSRKPVLDTDYSITWGSSDWTLGSDGYWYYRLPVAPTASTADLIELCSPIGVAPEGYHLEVEVLTSAIQAEPERAVEEAWGASVSNGTLQAP